MSPELPLRDIHLPEPVGWWPLAPGWWIALAGLLIALVLIVRWYQQRRKRFAWHRSAKHELQQIKLHHQKNQDTQQLSKALSVLLRRVTISITPREEAAGLTGDEWLAFLDTLADKSLFNSSAGRQLLTAPYQPAHAIDAQQLLDLSHQWLDSVRQGSHV